MHTKSTFGPSQTGKNPRLLLLLLPLVAAGCMMGPQSRLVGTKEEINREPEGFANDSMLMVHETKYRADTYEEEYDYSTKRTLLWSRAELFNVKTKQYVAIQDIPEYAQGFMRGTSYYYADQENLNYTRLDVVSKKSQATHLSNKNFYLVSADDGLMEQCEFNSGTITLLNGGKVLTVPADSALGFAAGECLEHVFVRDNQWYLFSQLPTGRIGGVIVKHDGTMATFSTQGTTRDELFFHGYGVVPFTIAPGIPATVPSFFDTDGSLASAINRVLGEDGVKEIDVSNGLFVTKLEVKKLADGKTIFPPPDLP